jgi:hypothetical protein
VIPNGHEIYQHFPFQGPPKCTEIGIYGLKLNHLATLAWLSLFLGGGGTTSAAISGSGGSLVGDLDRTGESDGVMMISTLLAELQTDKL